MIIFIDTAPSGPVGAAHRYWRFTKISGMASGPFLDLAELEFWSDASTRADVGIVPTTNESLISGDLVTLTDGNFGGSGCYWYNPSPTTFWISWDFGMPTVVTGFKHAGSGASGIYMFTSCRVEYSDDGSVWTDGGGASGFTPVGGGVASPFIPFV